MKALRVIIIFVIPSLQTVALITGMAWPVVFFGTLFAALIVSDALMAFFFERKTARRQLLSMAFPSGALLLFTGTALSLIEISELRTGFIVINALLQLSYCATIYYAMHRPDAFQVQSLWHATFAVHIVSFFACAITFFGIVHYAVAPFRFILIPFMVIAFLYSYHFQSLLLTTSREQRIIAIIQTLILLECTLVLYWLPIIYYSKAFLLLVPYYLMGAAAINAKISTRGRYSPISVIILAVVLLLVLITLRWR